MDLVLFERLLYEEESPALDFKKEQYRFVKANDEDKSELLKDMLGFANSWRRSDAFILIGVEDLRGSRKNVVGIAASDHLDDHAVQQFVNNLTNCPIRFRYEAFSFKGKHVGIIVIEEQQPRPLFLKKDYGKLKRNEVYVRRGSSTDPTKPAQPDEIVLMGAGSGPQMADLAVEFADPAKDAALGTHITQDAEFCEMPPVGSIPDLAPRQELRSIAGVAEDIRLVGLHCDNPLHRLNENYFRELANYEFVRRLVRPVRLVISNVGHVAANDVRVELSVSAHSGSVVMESSALPDLPKRRASILSPALKGLHGPLRRAPGDVSIDEDQERFRVVIDYGDLQPGRRVWSEVFYVGRRASGDIAFSGQVLANNLRQPKKLSLGVLVNVRQTQLSVDALVSLPPPCDDE